MASTTRKPPPRPSALQGNEDRPAKQTGTLLGFAVCFVALAVGISGLKISNVVDIGSYGLIEALSPLYWLAIALLIISFAWNLRAERYRSLLLGTHLTILVFLVNGAPSIIEGDGRFQSAYLHTAFSNYIANTGTLLQSYDARFSWPSFFAGVAMLDKVAGVNSAEAFIRWWPVAINLLYLPPIYGIAKELLRSTPKAWLAAGLFPLTNWVGQDYFSPQALTYLLYLTFVFILVVPFRAHDRPAWRRLLRRTNKDFGPNRQTQSGRPPRPEPGRRRAAGGFYLGALVLLMAAMATGHQLTPIMAIITSVILVIAGRTQVRGMVMVGVLIAVGWVCYGAEPFWSGHISMIVGGVGNVGGNVNAGVAQRVTGSAAHGFILDIRLLTTAAVWGLAALGALVWRLRSRDRDWAVVVLLFLGAFTTIVGGNYGGEGVLRVYFFSLPGAICLIAALISKLPRFWHGQVALACFGLLLTPLFFFARWGNELYEMVRPDELTATNELYRIATPGSNFVSLTWGIEWEYVDLTTFSYNTLGVDTIGPQTLTQITAAIAGNPKGGYVIMTTGQQAFGSLVSGLPTNWGRTVDNMLTRSSNYKLVYQNRDAEIFQYIRHPTVKKSSARRLQRPR
ncbi:hypothetical protein EAS64_07275 [Trebonia kvetii]|uniref:Glycosyltransferase RgtA/B/C/D-like domain-containing protein n=1 Tax=Trebonia kvetii TaxID=2480626 RepID=A0A6P2C7W6_9ACTN|nr:hypothetical protein [Trebonia kvetii]TVZ07107.1 hypothetical protein EAS64_07275 [Trebonia kvetii]